MLALQTGCQSVPILTRLQRRARRDGIVLKVQICSGGYFLQESAKVRVEKRKFVVKELKRSCYISIIQPNTRRQTSCHLTTLELMGSLLQAKFVRCQWLCAFWRDGFGITLCRPRNLLAYRAVAGRLYHRSSLGVRQRTNFHIRVLMPQSRGRAGWLGGILIAQ